MLDKLSQEYVANNFKTYDQNWLFYKNFLGEPFLIQDVLVYFDGEILYVCAFSFNDLMLRISLDLLMPQIEEIIPINKIKAIDIWGNIDSKSSMFSNNRIIDYTPPMEGMYNCIIDINTFSLEKNRKARLAYQAAQNSEMSYKILQRKILSYEHLNIMKDFLAKHDLGNVGKEIFLSLREAVKLNNAYLVEAYNSDTILKGFALIIVPSKDSAVYSLACFDNSTRAADIVMYGCIDFCKKNQISKLHLGYSATKGLLNFKRKWGGSSEGQKYEEYFLNINADTNIIKHIENGTFLWHNRLILN